MKARIVPSAPVALLYGLAAESAAFAALESQGFETRAIAPAQLSQSVGALTGEGGRARAPYTGEAPQCSLLVLSTSAPAQRNAALDAVRAAGAAIDYRAVVTKHNRHWTVLELLAELAQERAALERSGTDER